MPDLILADFNLPDGMDGLLVAATIREKLQSHIPVMILTGDISTDNLQRIAGEDCLEFNKPVKTADVVEAIQSLLPGSRSAPRQHVQHPTRAAPSPNAPVIFLVDDDTHVREGIRDLLESDGRIVEDFASCEAFLKAYRPGQAGCLLVDAYLPGMTGLELLQRLRGDGDRLPAIMITGNSDVPMSVRAMKAGARDFIEKPSAAKSYSKASRVRSTKPRTPPSYWSGKRRRPTTSPVSRRDSARSWVWCSQGTPARISPPTSRSASAPSKIIAPRS